DDRGRPLSALADLFQGLVARGLVVLGLEGELRVVQDGREDIVEFVRDTRCQRSDAAEALGLEQLLTQLVGIRAGNHDVLACHWVASRIAAVGVQDRGRGGPTWGSRFRLGSISWSGAPPGGVREASFGIDQRPKLTSQKSFLFRALRP